jgi:hypothetical protein
MTSKLTAVTPIQRRLAAEKNNAIKSFCGRDAKIGK